MQHLAQFTQCWGLNPEHCVLGSHELCIRTLFLSWRAFELILFRIQFEWISLWNHSISSLNTNNLLYFWSPIVSGTSVYWLSHSACHRHFAEYFTFFPFYYMTLNSPLWNAIFSTQWNYLVPEIFLKELDSFIFYILDIFMYGVFLPACVCTPHTRLEPVDVRGGCQIALNMGPQNQIQLCS